MTKPDHTPRSLPDRPLVIATHLDRTQNERLAAHWSRPRVISYTDDHPVSEVPAEADLLFTFYSGWSRAPEKAPRGWPFSLRWIQAASAGVDAFPAWFFSGPVVTCGRGVNTVALSEFVLAAILAHEKCFFDGLRVNGPADWKTRTLGCVEGKTLGLFGFGAIGKAVARRARALDMRLVAVNRSGRSNEEIEIVDSA
ncbi:MAG: hypothetical protein LBR95_07895, partial [Azoarcus sp.]|nr:hypothetical protein [Azoarcus sp.]